jgi:hypothetical protein
VGPYIPYGLFQTKGETCAKFGSDRCRNVDLYKVQTNIHTYIHTFIFIFKIIIIIILVILHVQLYIFIVIVFRLRMCNVAKASSLICILMKCCVRWLVVCVNITVVTKEMFAYFYKRGT